MVRSRLFTTACVAAALAVAVACSNTPGSPTSPSAASPGQPSAVGDFTLKTGVPSLVSPENDFAFDSGTAVTLEFNPTRATYVDFQPAYEIEIRNNADGQVVYTQVVGASSSTISHALPPVPTGTYEWHVRAADGDGRGGWSDSWRFTMKAPVRGPSTTGPRRANPPDGGRLPAPDRFDVVVAVANQFPHMLFGSCQEHGGSWDFMDTVVDTLRRIDDTRWGYIWKRGVVGDPLQDVIGYNWGSDPDEGTRNVYTIDIIGGHCGSFPVPVWNNTQPGGGPGLSSWTGRGRF